MTSTMTPLLDQDAPRFLQFPELSEDVAQLVISFIADAPMEEKVPGPIDRYRPAALTTSLPLVNQRFLQLSNMDMYWQPALSRQLQSGKQVSNIWKEGLRRLVPSDSRGGQDDEILKALHNDLSYKEIYKRIYTNHIHFTAPIFIMPCHVQIGETYGLHLFEPRYRVMVHNLIANCGNPEQASFGERIEEGVTEDGYRQAPLLVHACLRSRLGPGQMACLVEVVWCQRYRDGTADVQLKPVGWVQLEKIWVQPSSGHLFYGQVRRLQEGR